MDETQANGVTKEEVAAVYKSLRGYEMPDYPGWKSIYCSMLVDDGPDAVNQALEHARVYGTAGHYGLPTH